MNVAETYCWNEDGDRVDWLISSADITIHDIPRLVREHRDLRQALYKAVALLESLEDFPVDARSTMELEFIKRVKKRNPL